MGARRFLSVVAFSSIGGEVSNDYYNQTFLGEKDLGEYHGPLDGRFTTNTSTEKSTLLDDLFAEQYLNDYLGEEIFRLGNHWINETYPDISCPNQYLSDNYSYIRYLYRLIGISYLFEAMREYRIESYRLGISPKSCSLEWKDTFEKCVPKSVEMKKFLARIRDRHLMGLEKERLVKQNKKKVNLWIRGLNEELRTGKYSGVVARRISQEVPSSSPITLVGLKKTFDKVCTTDGEIIRRLCSESDNYYGFSDVGIFTYLLQKANTVAVINSGGYGRACLKRFAEINSSKENKIGYLKSLTEDIYQKIRKLDLRYKQGNIFIAGALKEFDDKGLDDFIFVAKKEVPKPKPKPVVVVKKVEPKPVPKPVVVVKKVEPKPIPKPAPMAKAIKRVTQFEVARRKLLKGPQLSQVVNMVKFKNDFEFTDAMTKALKEPLVDFQTRQGLADMKRWDKLGSKTEPVRLIFLKFLIDNNLHTGLYNIVAVLGKHFYVVNDIDGIKDPVYTGLKNDESTKYQWTLTLYKVAPKKKKKLRIKIKK